MVISGLILSLHPAYERRCYFVTTSHIGWAQALNQPCNIMRQHRILVCDQFICICYIIHWNENVIFTKFSSLIVLEIVKMTASMAANDKNFIKMTGPCLPLSWKLCNENSRDIGRYFPHEPAGVDEACQIILTILRWYNFSYDSVIGW